jgi:hypothetical protein
MFSPRPQLHYQAILWQRLVGFFGVVFICLYPWLIPAGPEDSEQSEIFRAVGYPNEAYVTAIYHDSPGMVEAVKLLAHALHHKSSRTRSFLLIDPIGISKSTATILIAEGFQVVPVNRALLTKKAFGGISLVYYAEGLNTEWKIFSGKWNQVNMTDGVYFFSEVRKSWSKTEHLAHSNFYFFIFSYRVQIMPLFFLIQTLRENLTYIFDSSHMKT